MSEETKDAVEDATSTPDGVDSPRHKSRFHSAMKRGGKWFAGFRRTPSFIRHSPAYLKQTLKTALRKVEKAAARGVRSTFDVHGDEKKAVRRWDYAVLMRIPKTDSDHDAPPASSVLSSLVAEGFSVDMFEVFAKHQKMILFLLVASTERLVKEANHLKIERWLAAGASGDLSLFEGEEAASMTFTPSERLECIHSILVQLECVQSPLLEEMYPIHDLVENDKLLTRWNHTLLLKDEDINELREHFGDEVGWYFAWITYTTRFLIPLAIIGFLVFISEFFLDSSTNIRVENFFGMGVVLWASIYIEFWIRRCNELKLKWDLVDFKPPKTIRKEFRGEKRFNPVTSQTELYYPNWKRWLKATVLFPFLALQWMFLYVIVGLILWWELWIIFVWGDCASEGCDTSAATYGVWGFLHEALPGLAEAIFFEILLVVFEYSADKFCTWQNFRTQQAYDKCYSIFVFGMEAVGVFLWFFIVAFYFVPTFNGESQETCAYGYFAESSFNCMKATAGYATRVNMMKAYLITPFCIAQLANVGLKSLLPACIHRALSTSRQKLGCCLRNCQCFCASVGAVLGYKGGRREDKYPGVDAESLAPRRLLKTVNDDNIVEELRKQDGASSLSFLHEHQQEEEKLVLESAHSEEGEEVEMETHAAAPEETAVAPSTNCTAVEENCCECCQCQCCCPGCLRPEAGSACDYVQCCRVKRAEKRLAFLEVLASREPGISSPEDDIEDLDRIIGEGMMWEFRSFTEYLEIVIQFCWIAFFSVMFPLGAVFAFLNNLVEMRSDLYKLGHVNQRPVPKRADGIGTWLPILRWCVWLAIIVNLSLMIITLDSFASWMDDYTNLQEDWRQALLTVFVVERVMIFLIACFKAFIPDYPKAVRDAIKTREAAFRRVLCQEIVKDDFAVDLRKQNVEVIAVDEEEGEEKTV